MSIFTKTKQLKLCILMIAFSCGILTSYGQEETGNVNGIVRKENGEPVASVTVVAKNNESGQSTNTQTDTAGVFRFSRLPVRGTYSFSFSSVGFQTQTLSGYTIKPNTSISIITKLQQQSSALNEVVVVGYGTQKKANLTGAVAQVSGDVLDRRSISNISQGLQGMIPNLNLVMGDGKPMQSPAFNIRGGTSIGQGGNALVLIDGVQGDPSLINPNDVATVTVLKDAASSAIYGARAAFGVVLITTKTPAKDKVTVTYSSNYSLKMPTAVPDVSSNGYQYALMFDSAWSAWNNGQIPQNINKTQPYSRAYLAEFAKRDADPSLPKTDVVNGNYVYYGNTNWYDLLYKKNLGAMDQNLSVSGNSGKASYYISGRYYGQAGLFRYNSDDYKMYNITAKGSVDVLPWLNIYNTTQYSNRGYHNPLNVGEGGGIWRNLADEGHTSAPLFNPDGTLTFSAAYTVGDFVYGRNGINIVNQYLRNTTGFAAKIIGNKLRLKGDFTFQSSDSNATQIRVPIPYSVSAGIIAPPLSASTTNDLQVAGNRTQYLASNIYTEYETTFKEKHYIKALVGYNYEQSVYNRVTTLRNGLIYPDATNINLAFGQNIVTSGYYDKWAILGGFGRLNYAFKDRYLVEVNGRYDGSSKFPGNQHYGFFPSVSAGWRIAKESFWKVDPKVISDIKIRGSYGSLGNGNIASYSFLENFGISQSGRVINNIRPQQTGSPGVIPDGLTWETATTSDLGVDITALSNRLTFTGDIYKRNTTNMFTVGKTLPAVFGATVPKGNYADMRTIGWEGSINWHDQFKAGSKALHYSIGFWMSDYKSTITRYNNTTKILTDYYKGMTLGEIWGYTNDGYWTSADVSKAAAFQPTFKATNNGTWGPGDIKFKDINGKGVINNGANTVNDPGAMRIIGNSQPRYTYGFSLSADWGGFFFSAFLQGVGHQDWWPGTESDVFWGQYNRPYNYLMQYQVGKIWSPSNPDTYFPRYRGYVAQNAQGELAAPQTKYLQNVAYLRLKNIQIGYSIPAALVRKVKLTAARFYITGENLLSYSPLYKLTKDLDVENIGKSDVILTGTSNNGNGNNYPILKSITAGVTLTF
ncbi:MAG: SusC/RagA family TonB-linked outer membrane protein [Bacteroidota bacterium]